MLMTPGLAFFYGGLERRKNVLNTMMMSFFIMGIASVLWIAIGYSLSFAGDHGGIIGSLQNAFGLGLGCGPSAYAPTIPKLAYVAFQMMFALITPALITGAVLGLVAITPGAGFVPIWTSFIIGGVVSPLAYFMVSVVKPRLGYDDALDAFGCHGIGGIWGGIATGLFASRSVNPAARWNGLVFGDTHLFFAQLIAISATIVIAVFGTFVIAKVVSIFVPLRVDAADERSGLDISQHGEKAYPSFTGMD